MKINKKEVYSQKMDFFDYDIKAYPYLKMDREHYKLLTYLTKSIDGITIIDAGTSQGHSCLALAQNEKNKVITYDIFDKHFSFFESHKNIEFKKMDINNESPIIIKSAKIILLDIDPHDGIQEIKFTNYLKEIGYKGYVICDDINLNQPMRNWWNSIDIEKYDVTDIGHGTGTGIINYNDEKILISE